MGEPSIVNKGELIPPIPQDISFWKYQIFRFGRWFFNRAYLITSIYTDSLHKDKP